MSGCKVRAAEESDLDDILHVERSCFSSPYPPTYLELYLKLRVGIFLVAEVDGEVVGYSLVAFRGVDAFLLSIAVLPSKRNRGIGRALLSESIAKARAKGTRSMRLEVAKDNSPAINLYRSLGFREVGEIPDYYGPGIPALSVRLDLF